MKNITAISTKAPHRIKKSMVHDELMQLQTKFLSLQNVLYAEKKYALLIVLQGMDASGKDGTIRRVFSSTNPQGCKVKSFKTPTSEEKLHDFLWRVYANLPEKGMIQIFNRSHYEELLFPVVHKQIDKKELKKREKTVNMFEEHLENSGTVILKFYLHISKKEQQIRLKKRLVSPDKKWKYDPADKKEAEKWNVYMHAYQHVFNNCSKAVNWLIVPADSKWYRDYIITTTIISKLESLHMKYPTKPTE